MTKWTIPDGWYERTIGCACGTTLNAGRLVGKTLETARGESQDILCPKCGRTWHVGELFGFDGATVTAPKN